MLSISGSSIPFWVASAMSCSTRDFTSSYCWRVVNFSILQCKDKYFFSILQINLQKSKVFFFLSREKQICFFQPPYSLLHNEGPQPHPRPFSNHRRRTQLTPGASRPVSEFLYGSQAFALRVRHGLSIGWRIEIALRIYTIVKTLGYGVKPQDHLSFYKRVWRTD